MPVPRVPSPPPGLLAARVRDPYPYFAWLRRHAPAHADRRPGRPTVWQISRYADVRALLTDGRLSKDPGRVPGYVPGPAGLNRHLVHAGNFELPTDIRAGMCLVVAGLVAEGTTRLSNIHELQRKYDHLVQKLCALGADVQVRSES